MSFASGVITSLIYTTVTVYRVTSAGLDPIQLVLVGTVLEVAYFALQVPTGLVADTYSRKKSVVAGVIILGLAFVLEGVLPFFLAIALSQVVRALGLSLITGALEAWIADEVDEQRLSATLLRGNQLELFGGLLGTAAAGLVASISLNLPLIAGGIAMVLLGAFLAGAMQETVFEGSREDCTESRPDVSAWRSFRDSTKTALSGAVQLIRSHPVLLSILGVVAFYGATSEGFDRLWQAHFLEDLSFPSLGRFEPVVWFSIMGVVASLLSIGVSEILRRWGKLDQSKSVVVALAVITVGLAGATVILALAGNFYLALCAYLVTAALHKAYTPVITAWVAQHVTSRIRATVLSVKDMFDATGQFAGGLAIGAVGSIAGLRAALTLAGLLLLPILVLLGIAGRKVVDDAGQSAESPKLPYESEDRGVVQ
ncbi:MFS transporter [Mycobacteroides abscessus]|uniref:MFS transporter n=1 Tax=Mycobacteroides abscessus TaxID=36809 RepID=UPI000C25EBDE|nr:MFS transporter [Mycobacteroides abscessus]